MSPHLLSLLLLKNKCFKSILACALERQALYCVLLTTNWKAVLKLESRCHKTVKCTYACYAEMIIIHEI